MPKERSVYPQERLGAEASIRLLDPKIYSAEELSDRRPAQQTIRLSRNGTEREFPIFAYDSNLHDELAAGVLTEQRAHQMLEALLLGRELERMSVHLTYRRFDYRYGELTREDLGTLTFPTHLAIGQEAMSVGLTFALDAEDYITSTHRGHIDALVKGFRYLVDQPEERLSELLDGSRDIADHIELSRNAHGRDELLDQMVDLHTYRTIAELFGKKHGYCDGKGGGMHLAWREANNLGNNAIVAGLLGIGCGSGIASKLLGDGRTTATIAGDGGYLNENSYGAINFATMGQFRNGMMSTTDGPPVIFVCYNNQYAMTVQQRGEVTSNDFMSERFIAFNDEGLHAETAFGMDVLAVYDSIRRAKEICDDGRGPVFRELWGYRYFGHSLSDDAMDFSGRGVQSYRRRREIYEWKNYDPVSLFASGMVHAGILTEAGLGTVQKRTEERVQRLALLAAKADFPETHEMLDKVYATTTSDIVPPEFKDPTSPGEAATYPRDKEGRIAFSESIREALSQEMRRDGRVVVMGEDIGEYGGAFGETKGLREEFGVDRVFNTPLCESNIAGTATGMALRGMRPVAQASMYIDFFTQALDQVANHAAKLSYMSGGQLKVPVVFWTHIGGGMGYAGQHSQSIETMVTMFPGLKVVAPATGYDAKGLMVAAIREDNPVVFLGHQNLYKNIGCNSAGFVPVPEDLYTVPIGEANVVRKVDNPEDGKAVTIVSYSWMLYSAMDAASKLEDEGYQPEVIDLRTLLPIDIDTIARSVLKTGRLVIAQQAVIEGGLGEQIVGRLMSEQTTAAIAGPPRKSALSSLMAPVEIVGAPFCIPPAAMKLEKSRTVDGERIRGFIPGDVEIVEAAKKTLA